MFLFGFCLASHFLFRFLSFLFLFLVFRFRRRPIAAAAVTTHRRTHDTMYYQISVFKYYSDGPPLLFLHIPLPSDKYQIIQMKKWEAHWRRKPRHDASSSSKKGNVYFFLLHRLSFFLSFFLSFLLPHPPPTGLGIIIATTASIFPRVRCQHIPLGPNSRKVVTRFPDETCVLHHNCPFLMAFWPGYGYSPRRGGGRRKRRRR